MITGKLYRRICVSIGIALSVSCSTIKPEKPVTTVVESPPPPSPVTTDIVVPIEIDLSSYFKEADKTVPKITTGSDKPCSGIRYDFLFQKDSFEISTSNNLLLSELVGSYWIKMEYCAACSGLFTDKPVCLSPLIPNFRSLIENF